MELIKIQLANRVRLLIAEELKCFIILSRCQIIGSHLGVLLDFLLGEDIGANVDITDATAVLGLELGLSGPIV